MLIVSCMHLENVDLIVGIVITCVPSQQSDCGSAIVDKKTLLIHKFQYAVTTQQCILLYR